MAKAWLKLGAGQLVTIFHPEWWNNIIIRREGEGEGEKKELFVFCSPCVSSPCLSSLVSRLLSLVSRLLSLVSRLSSANLGDRKKFPEIVSAIPHCAVWQ